jgi:hypothetical protein
MIGGKEFQRQMATAFRSVPQSFPLEIARHDGAENHLSLHNLVSILDAVLEVVACEPSPPVIVGMSGKKLGSKKQ